MGSDFGVKSFDIEIAFDHLTEVQFRKLRKVFGTKHIQELIFDERPYKKYLAKLENPVEFSYICFDEPIKIKFSEEYNIGTINTGTGSVSGEVLSELPDGVRMIDDGQGNRIREKIDPWIYKEGTQRIYKGEGKMTFVCHFPFAKSTFKILPNNGNNYYEGSDEWAVSSGILSANDRQSLGIDIYNDGAIRVYNPGDVEVGFRLYIPAASVSQATTLSYEDARLVINPIQLKTNSTGYTDAGVIIDTNTGLINGLVSPVTIDSNGNALYTISGNIYNENVQAGCFFKLQPNNYKEYSTLQIISTGTGFQIFYDYLYF